MFYYSGKILISLYNLISAMMTYKILPENQRLLHMRSIFVGYKSMGGRLQSQEVSAKLVLSKLSKVNTFSLELTILMINWLNFE